MSAEVARKQFEALNRHDVEAYSGFYAENAVVYDPAYAEPLKGRSAVRKDMEDFLRAFPDLQAASRAILADGNVLAIEFSMAGTHKGPLSLPAGEVAATGRTLSFEGGVFARLNAAGEIVEERRYYDLAGQMAQLGVG